jgi:tryptophan 2,3-dioxygenase
VKKVTYSGYLRLPDIFAAVQPLTPVHRGQVYGAEHFFIVTHQASELWLKQLLVDLESAISAIRPPHRDLEQAVSAVDRAAEVMRLLTEHVRILRKMSPRDFADFRERLGEASGAHSAQFDRVRKLLGVEDTESPLLRELVDAAGEQATSLRDIYGRAHCNGVLYRLAEAMADLSQAFWSWQLFHVEVVSKAIGRARGTGHTSGVDYLSARLRTPFPELWEARALLHAPSVTTGLG